MQLTDREELNTNLLIAGIEFERNQQWKKWGQQTHSLSEWSIIASEEVGEFLKEVCEVELGGKQDTDNLIYELNQAITVLCNIKDMLLPNRKGVKK